MEEALEEEALAREGPREGVRPGAGEGAVGVEEALPGAVLRIACCVWHVLQRTRAMRMSTIARMVCANSIRQRPQ